MSTAGSRRIRKRDVLWLVLGILLPFPWLVSAWGAGHVPVLLIAPMAGLAILGAAFMLSWACELAERDLPQSLALLMLALVGVLPEYAIDLHFAWTAGKDPSYAAYAVANMTGANRILIGLGWVAVVLTSCARTGKDYLEVHPRQRLELRFLIWATLYSFLIPLSGSISLFDAAVLLSLFLLYVSDAMRGDSFEPELAGPAALIDSYSSSHGRRFWALGLFLFAAAGIYLSAEPFAESLVEIGGSYEIDEFLLVQWLAPLASESPEFVVAVLFALKLRGTIGLGTLVSSKVNQWTLLVGAIPIAYAISSGGFSGLPLDSRQTGELLLTSAQSLLAAILLSNLRFTRTEALLLAGLFLAQFGFTSTIMRNAFTLLYLALSLGVLVFGPAEQRNSFFRLVFSSPFSSVKEGHE
jgi:cation:H+ antiporter